jgi:hypothetical protein
MGGWGRGGWVGGWPKACAWQWHVRCPAHVQSSNTGSGSSSGGGSSPRTCGWRVHEVKVDKVVNAQRLEQQHHVAQVGALHRGAGRGRRGQGAAAKRARTVIPQWQWVSVGRGQQGKSARSKGGDSGAGWSRGKQLRDGPFCTVQHQCKQHPSSIQPAKQRTRPAAPTHPPTSSHPPGSRGPCCPPAHVDRPRRCTAGSTCPQTCAPRALRKDRMQQRWAWATGPVLAGHCDAD